MFGFGGGKGMGGGPKGANMLRAVVGRTAVSRTTASNPTSTFQEPLNSSTSRRNNNSNNSNGYVSVSSSSGTGSSSLGSYNSNNGVPISANYGLPSNWPVSSGTPCFDEFDWVSVDAIEEDQQPRDFLLGPVPSLAEVQNAVTALQRVSGVNSSRELIRDKFSYNAGGERAYQLPSPDIGSMPRVHSAGSELEWMEPSMQLYNTRAFQPYVTNNVYDAFHLLQTDQTVQKMVISLSSDEAVWNAVLNNEVVRELRESYYAAEDGDSVSFYDSSDENSDEPNKTTNIVNWIFDNTKAKILDLFEKISSLVNELFKLSPPDNDTKTTDPFDDKLRTSLVLSVLVLLIVVVTRSQTA